MINVIFCYVQLNLQSASKYLFYTKKVFTYLQRYYIIGSTFMKNKSRRKGKDEMMLIANGEGFIYRIEAEPGTACEYARDELLKYTEKLLNVGENKDEQAPVIYIGTADWLEKQVEYKSDNLKFDGYEVKRAGADIIIASKCARGTLYAVYDIFYDAGCRWYTPYAKDEYYPAVAELGAEEKLCNPSFELRNFTYDGNKDVNRSEEIQVEFVESIEWFAKIKANAFFIHGTHFGVDEKLMLNAARELKKRGMLIELGGHGVHHFVDQNLFETQPELFREAEGARVKDGNFCISNPDAVKMACDGAQRVFETYEETGIDTLHLWFEDSMSGSWCNCEKCRDKSPQEQQMFAINEIAKRVKTVAPTSKVDMLLYHDTLDLDKINAKPEDNVYAYFAPRERCRYHSAADTSCQRNITQFNALKAAKERFGDNTYIFEYYADYILFMQLAIFSPTVIEKDLKEYLDLGINKVSCLMFGRYSWWAYAGNMYVYANLAWNVDFDHARAFSEQNRMFFSGCVDFADKYLRLLERASNNMQAFCKYDDSMADLRNIPPVDLPFNKAHIKLVTHAAGIYRMLDSMAKTEIYFAEEDVQRERLHETWLSMHLSAIEADAIRLQMLGLYHLEKGEIEKGNKLLEECIELRISNAEWFTKNVPLTLRGVNDSHHSELMIDWNKKMLVRQ